MLLDYSRWKTLNESKESHGEYVSIDYSETLDPQRISLEDVEAAIRRAFDKFSQNCKIDELTVSKKGGVYLASVMISLMEEEGYDLFGATQAVQSESLAIGVTLPSAEMVHRQIGTWRQSITLKKNKFLLIPRDYEKSDAEIIEDFLKHVNTKKDFMRDVLSPFARTSYYRYTDISEYDVNLNLTGSNIEAFFFEKDLEKNKKMKDMLNSTFSYLASFEMLKAQGGPAFTRTRINFEQYSQEIRQTLSDLATRADRVKSTGQGTVQFAITLIPVLRKLTQEAEYHYPQQKLAAKFLIDAWKIVDRSGVSEEFLDQINEKMKERARKKES